MLIKDLAVTVSGFATPGTLLVAFLAFNRQRREDQLASARLVIAALDRNSPTPNQIAVKVTNHGDGPISQVWIGVPGDALSEHHISLIPPGESASVTVTPEANGDDQRPWTMKYLGCGGPMTATEPRVQLRFLDARNQAWQRDGYDKPTRSKAEPDRPLVSLPGKAKKRPPPRL